MRTVLTLLSLACAAPLAAQSAADSTAIRAIAMRQVPRVDSAGARVTRLEFRGDTAVVAVRLAEAATYYKEMELTLVRRAERWEALPQFTITHVHLGKP